MAEESTNVETISSSEETQQETVVKAIESVETIEQPEKQEPREESSLVPSHRLREEREKRSAAEESAKKASSQLEKLQNEIKTLQEQHEKLSVKYSSDLALISEGISDPEVQEFIRDRYIKSQADQKEKTSFADWFKDKKKNPDSILKPFLTPKEIVQEKVEKKPIPDVQNPEVGVEAPASTPTKWTSSQIKRIREQNRGGLGPYKDEILKAYKSGLISQ